jgi:hypothetical protein
MHAANSDFLALHLTVDHGVTEYNTDSAAAPPKSIIYGSSYARRVWWVGESKEVRRDVYSSCLRLSTG